MSSNPLLSPPFFTIPGISPDDPISAQMEQIDQLNTLLLQDIDANFARFHQVITAKLLPEIKRFSLANEPTREASKFWRSFFEAAALVKVPVPGEESTAESQTGSPAPRESYEDHDEMLEGHSYTSEEGTFLFGQGAASSTPMRKKNGNERAMEPSWASPSDSPFERIDQKLNILKIGQHDEVDASSQETPSVPEGYSRQQASYSMGQMEEYDEEPSVLINRRDWDRGQAQTSAAASSGIKADAPTPKPQARQAPAPAPHSAYKASPRRPHASQNPFINATASSSRPGASKAPAWNGIVDMRNTPLNPRVKKLSAGPSSRPFDLEDDTMDETDDEMMADLGMSPPVTMNFTLPQRNLAKTPAKEAAKLVLSDLMREIGGGGTPSPQMPTPPSFAKYGGMTPGLTSGAGRRLFQEALDEDAAALVEDDDGRPRADQSLQDSTVDEGEADGSYRDEDTYHAPRQAQFPQSDESYEQDTIQAGQGHPAEAAPDDASTTDLLHLNSTTLSPAMSEGGRVFGGGQGGRGGFNLFGPDEIHTFHGGRLEDAGTSVAESPSYGLGKMNR